MSNVNEYFHYIGENHEFVSKLNLNKEEEQKYLDYILEETFVSTPDDYYIYSQPNDNETYEERIEREREIVNKMFNREEDKLFEEVLNTYMKEVIHRDFSREIVSRKIKGCYKEAVSRCKNTAIDVLEYFYHSDAECLFGEDGTYKCLLYRYRLSDYLLQYYRAVCKQNINNATTSVDLSNRFQ